LDGGEPALAIFEQVDPRAGRRKSLILSAALAGAVAIFGALEQSSFLALMFVILAVSSVQWLDGLRGRVRSQPYLSTR
jgi:hypothetical protein